MRTLPSHILRGLAWFFMAIALINAIMAFYMAWYGEIHWALIHLALLTGLVIGAIAADSLARRYR